jgi:hypothetical protein
VSRATVTGTGIAGLIVTGTVQPGPGTNIPLPPGTHYQYITLDPAQYTTITGAQIVFSVPESWLAENHFSPGDITLDHYAGSQWNTLPTTMLKTENGMVWFSATSPGFSPFVITGQAGTSAGSTVTAHASPVPGSSVPSQAPATRASTPAISVAGLPAAQQTTALPAPALSDPGFPLATVALIGAGCIVLVSSGWYIRRWWIHRQNPALFREYD